MNAPTNIKRTSRRRRSGRILLSLLVSFMFMVGFIAVSARLASANTLTVTTTDDLDDQTQQPAAGSLRAAIAQANPGDTIEFAIPPEQGNTITLEGGQLSITKNLTIEGTGADTLAVSGNNASRIFYIAQDVNVTISGITIKDGNSGSAIEGGGGIYIRGGTVNLTNSIVSDNTSSYNGGGGIVIQDSTVNLTNSSVSNNIARGIYGTGGGVQNSGTLNITNSSVNNNTAEGSSIVGAGGGIVNYETTSIRNSSVSNNTATERGGGGIYNYANRTMDITNSTVSGNTATGVNSYGGGGIYNGLATLTITNSTVSNNTANTAGGINNSYYQYPGTITIGNTIIAGNSALPPHPEARGPFISQGHNLIGKADGTSGFTNDQNGDQVGTVASPIDSLLGPLQDNGGPTQTHALLPGSPAIDKAVAVEGITTDQRGVARPQGAAPDIGSFELVQDSTAPVTTPSAKTADGNTYNSGAWTNQDVTITLTASDEGGSGVDKIFYSTDGSANYQEYTTPLSVTSEGTTTLSYYATDKATNQGETKTFTAKIDKSAPTTTRTLSAQPNANGWYNKDVTITLSATDQAALSGVKEITYSATGAQPVAEKKVPGSSTQLIISTEGQTTITYFATDQAGNAEQPKTLTIKLDKSAPRVVSVTPLNGTKGVARGTNVTATFSERMQGASVKSSFKLYKGSSTTSLAANVSYDATTKKATLNPFGSSTTLLAKGVTYRAVVSTGAVDMAGNPLAQQMVWYFTIRT